MRKRCLSEKMGCLTLVGLMVGSLAWSMDVRGAYLPLGREQAVDKVQDFEVQDSQRQRRLPVRVFLPASKQAAPVILFSHGLGGSPAYYSHLGEHWAGRGFAVVMLQHPGSDSAVWQGKAPRQRQRALKAAASVKNLIARAEDVPAVLNQLERWHQQKQHPLYQRLDLSQVGMSGHSFGAITTQAVSGQALPNGRQPYLEPRIRAALAMSPSPPRRGLPQQAFAKVKLPWLLMTGTLDDSPLGDLSAVDRLQVFPALPSGNKFQLVLSQARHSIFSNRPLPGEPEARSPQHQQAILGISTAFWECYLRQEPSACNWLKSSGPHSLLTSNDQWQQK